MNTEDILQNNNKLLGDSRKDGQRICFMCFKPIPSKKVFGKTNAFRTVACDDCYKMMYKGERDA